MRRRVDQCSIVSLAAFALGSILLVAQPAHAVPTLQLGVPGATYIQSGSVDVNGTTVPLTDSNFTLSDPFTLQVLGATSPSKVTRITDLKLYISFEANDFLANPGGSVTVTNVTNPGSPIVITAEGPAQYGTPSELSPHGIFPTYFFVYDLPDLDVASEAYFIPNTQPGETGSDLGDILTLNIAYSGFFYLHMDAAGTAVMKNGSTKSVFAPYSHDADGVPQTPEPATLSLLGLGLLGLGVLRRRQPR
jgi:hypothetical protein